MLTQFKNCHILRDHKIIREDLWVRDGKIIDPENIFFDERNFADEQVDCCGALVSPGFIDIQINGNILLIQVNESTSFNYVNCLIL